jgi:hypothetical protein
MMQVEHLVGEGETEFISEQGECRDQTIWFGELRTARRRATIIPAGISITSQLPPPEIGISPIGQFLYIPDAAIARARLSRECGALLSLTLVHPGIEVLTGNQALSSPLVRGFTVAEVLAYQKKSLRKYFKQRKLRPAVLITRGCRVPLGELEELFPKSGEPHAAVIFLNTAANGLRVVIAHPLRG